MAMKIVECEASMAGSVTIALADGQTVKVTVTPLTDSEQVAKQVAHDHGVKNVAEIQFLEMSIMKMVLQLSRAETLFYKALSSGKQQQDQELALERQVVKSLHIDTEQEAETQDGEIVKLVEEVDHEEEEGKESEATDEDEITKPSPLDATLGIALLKRKAEQQRFSHLEEQSEKHHVHYVIDGDEQKSPERNSKYRQKLQKEHENYLNYMRWVEAMSSPRRNNDRATFFD